MSACCYEVPRFQRIDMRSQEPLRPELMAVVNDIIGLRALSASTGFLTFKSQREMLAKLAPSDAAAVGLALRQLEKEQRETSK